ncbi:MAG: multicopper oxidase domain-containing protein, partial [Rhodobiaceae bacterium]|nr:multicopper oxidase domain-containing protein [Rhodobiaceae bacterium]
MDGAATPTWGFSQSYLGPVLRFRRGTSAHVSVKNSLPFPITSHWHGLHVPAIIDGGPQLQIAPGATWTVELPIDQPAATLWYHSHVGGVTAEQVYGGLSGMIIVDDPDAGDQGLPSDYGVDDIPLVIQDRAFGPDGELVYVKRGPALMHGFRADTILVNGAVRPVAGVPAGLVRLRLVNGSNARIYHLRFSDDRSFHQIASDGGLLPAPVPHTELTLAPAERAEVVVDFSDGA